MGTYDAWVEWDRGAQPFVDNRYSRAHRWRFDGGLAVDASASPQVVGAAFANPAGVDPEEAFVASLSSCHMLWFLGLAARRGYRVDSYRDHALGTMAKNARGKLAMTHVVLRPAVRFSGDNVPDAAAIDALHHAAHEECFIASSVLTEVVVEVPR